MWFGTEMRRACRRVVESSGTWWDGTLLSHSWLLATLFVAKIRCPPRSACAVWTKPGLQAIARSCRMQLFGMVAAAGMMQ